MERKDSQDTDSLIPTVAGKTNTYRHQYAAEKISCPQRFLAAATRCLGLFRQLCPAGKIQYSSDNSSSSCAGPSFGGGGSGGD